LRAEPSALFGLGHGADLVAVLKVDEAQAVGRAGREPHLLRLEANDLVAHGDDQQVVLGDAQHGHGRPSWEVPIFYYKPDGNQDVYRVYNHELK
jgi:hypothetical protein